jgi:hypothetical protein
MADREAMKKALERIADSIGEVVIIETVEGVLSGRLESAFYTETFLELKISGTIREYDTSTELLRISKRNRDADYQGALIFEGI